MAAPSGLGKALKRAREDAGLEQAAVAAKLGVHPVTISRWENERQPISGEWLSKLAELYGDAWSAVLQEALDRASDVARETLNTKHQIAEAPSAPWGADTDVSGWEPNPALTKVVPPRVYEVAIGYCRRLAAAGLPKEDIEEAERLLIDEGYAKLNKRARRPLTEEEQIEMLDATWQIMREALSWRGLRA